MFTIFWISQLSRVKRNFKSLEVFEERKHVLICVFMSSRYCVWRSPSKFCSTGTFAKTNIWSLRSLRVWVRHFTGNHLRELPTIPLLGLRASCSRSDGSGEVFLAWLVACGNVFLEALILHICRHHVWKQESSASCGLDLKVSKTQEQVFSPGLIHEGPPGSCAAAP